MSGIEIKREIEKTIASGSLGSWTIGVTDSTAITRARLQNPECWHCWQADSPQEAKSVHTFFTAKRMRNGNSTGTTPTYIYIY